MNRNCPNCGAPIKTLGVKMCPYCGTGCGINFVVKDGKIVGVEPWKRHPVNEGKVCPKGNFGYQFINHPDRLTTPLIKEDGELLNNSHKKQAEVAIVYDFDSQLISEIEDICGPDFKFDDWGAIKYYRYAHAGFYRMLTKLNYDVDYVLSCDLDKFDSYKVLYFPYHNMLKEKAMKAIEKFVKNGGTVILDEGFGMRDENTWMNPYDLKVEGMFKARYDKRRRVYGEVTVNINNEDIRVYPYTNIYKNNNINIKHINPIRMCNKNRQNGRYRKRNGQDCQLLFCKE